MERPIFKPIGTPEEELDTPILVVDLDKLAHNIETMHSFFRRNATKLRPHISAHGSPTIAHMQLAAGGTSGGITVSTLGQAEVFTSNGFNDVFIANLVVTKMKIRRLCALAQRNKITVQVDSPQNVSNLSEAATSNNCNINVLLNINSGLNSIGVDPGKPAVDLAKMINGSSGLSFMGLSTYEGTIIAKDEKELTSKTKNCVQDILTVREEIEKTGLDVRVISIGSTSNYEILGAMDDVTEIPAGSYALMDGKYRECRNQFSNAARIMSCVTSTPEAGNVITDAGRKAVGVDKDDPYVDHPLHPTIRGLSAEHGGFDFDPSTDHGLRLGDRVWLIPNDIAGAVNVHDYMFATKNGKLEAIWTLPARGRYN